MTQQEQIDKVRKDIKTYESNKKIKHLSTAAMIGSAALAVHGGFKGNKNIAIPALGASFASGFARGRSRKEEQAALNRIKRFYDLRNMEKRAVLGGVLEAFSAIPHLLGMTDIPSLSHMVNDGLQTIVSSPVASTIAAATPMAIDIAGLPYIASQTTKSTRNHAYVAAKDTLGMPLTAAEKSMRGFSTLARSGQLKIEKMQPGVLKNTATYFKGLFGPWGTGGSVGESAGVALKEIDKYSPRYKNLFLNAIKDDAGFEALKMVAAKDAKTLADAGKILDSAVDEVPGLRSAIRATGRNSEDFVKKIVNNPGEAVRAARSFKKTVRKGVAGSKYLLGAGLLAGIGYGLGNYRKRHPLSENKLPGEIAGDY